MDHATRHASVETPWGPSQYVDYKGPGIKFFGCAGHGGFHLDGDRQALVERLFPAFVPFAGKPWYEEDQDWTVVALAFFGRFTDQQIVRAVEIARWSLEMARERGSKSLRCEGWECVFDWLESDAAAHIKQIVRRVADEQSFAAMYPDKTVDRALERLNGNVAAGRVVL